MDSVPNVDQGNGSPAAGGPGSPQEDDQSSSGEKTVIHVKEGLALTVIKSFQKGSDKKDKITVERVISARLHDEVTSKSNAFPAGMSNKHRTFLETNPKGYVTIMTEYLSQHFKVWKPFPLFGSVSCPHVNFFRQRQPLRRMQVCTM